MNNKYVKWLTGGLLGLMAVFSLGSCSDDHYDLNSNNASGTLWENLVATGQCNDFAKIASRAIVNKKSYGTPASLTYEELLKGNKSLTVWAPKDGTYNSKEWLDMLDRAEELEAAGDRIAAAELYKTVEKQFVLNHLSYFNYNGSYPESKRIALGNGKYAQYDVANKTIKNVAINGQYSSVNGTLHLLTDHIPYAYDLKEIIDVYPQLSMMHDYIADKDTLRFIEAASTPGSVIDGQIQYVDSFFIEDNKIMPLIATQADSLAAAIYFTNNAWTTAVEKVKKFYNYKTAYAYVDEKNNVYTDSIKADSVQEARAVKAIFDNMYFSLYEQPAFDVKRASVESVKSFFESSDSLVSTEYYNKFDAYTPSYKFHQHAPECNVLSDKQTPIEASNGYAFLVDNFNFKANKSWQFDKTYEAENPNNINTQYSKSLSLTQPSGVRHTVSEGNKNDSVQGKVSGDQYQEFIPSSSAANPTVAFNLRDVLSGTYDIYVVVVPENIADVNKTAPKANKFTASLTYDFDDKGAGLSVVSIDGQAAQSGTATTYTSDVTKVDTILLFKDFKFDVCYYNISNSKPMLTITSAVKLADQKTCTRNLNIDCIRLVAKDE